VNACAGMCRSEHTIGQGKVSAGYQRDGLSTRKDYCLVGAIAEEKGFEVHILGHHMQGLTCCDRGDGGKKSSCGSCSESGRRKKRRKNRTRRMRRISDHRGHGSYSTDLG
jgi:hypothetical protein